MDTRHRLMKNLPLGGGALLVIALVVTMVWWIRGFLLTKTDKPVRVVQNITVIRPPPPPPEEAPPPPPPDKIDQQIPQNEPDPTPDNTPAPAADLGLDAEGSAGSDSFGLAARKGGSDLIGTGGAVFAWYTSKVKTQVYDCLSSDPKLHGKNYTAEVRIWIEADGRVKAVRIINGTGNHDLDGLIATDLNGIGHSDSPPIEMPQPISLKIVSHT
jgi:protein TonB